VLKWDQVSNSENEDLERKFLDFDGELVDKK